MFATVRRWFSKLAGALTGISPGPGGMMTGIMGRGSLDTAPRMGTQQLLEGAESMPWLRAVSDKIGTRVAQTEWCLSSVRKAGKAVKVASLQRGTYETRAAGLLARRDAGELVDEADHPFHAALANPNPYMAQMGIIKLTEVHVDVVGDAFWMIDRNQYGMPVGYWPVPPHWVDLPTIDQPQYSIHWRAWQALVPVRDVIWFHEPSASQPYGRGSGLGWSLGDELQVDEYAAKMAVALFVNRARPDYIVYGLNSPEEKTDLEMAFDTRLRGFWRAHRPMFLQGKPEFKEFQQQNLEQLVYPALRKVERDIVLQTAGAPPELFGIVENSNRATISGAEYLFDSYVIAPKCERMRGVLQRHIASDFDDRLILSYKSPIRADKEHELAVMAKAPHAWSTDEWRVAGGSRPVGGALGNARLVPLNSYLTDAPLDPEARPQAAPGGTPPKQEEAAV